ncbi:MAG: 5-demethoxyubiquinol-8 5-hydroxylase UbiM [Rhodobacteraceae bacterium]|nr:5-demethoxyubiquinol-8 5-hydroxylase UbiM [Paracoccaceae bacterium]
MARKDSFDIVIIGAGPAGLGFARALSGTGISIALVETQSQSVLEDPAEDGRDIALTHTSEKIMRDLGMWERIPADQIGTIRDAKVLNGPSPFALHFESKGSGADYLGRIVPNHLIRKSAYEVIKDQPNVTLICESEVTSVETDASGGNVGLKDGRQLQATLVIAADSRFSTTRRKMGLAASSLDFGRVVIVCEMTHELSHDDTAYECFHYEQTLAILPMFGNKSSVVVTLPSARADAVMQMGAAEFAADIARRFEGRLGAMKLVSKRHAYPLVGVLAKEFVTTRFALIGDAAVGMHPVTAHGYNLGLSGALLLAGEVRSALQNGRDIGDLTGLKSYEAAHKRAVLPLYHGTNALVRLYTDNSLPGRVLRDAALRLGSLLPPVKSRIQRQLTHIESHVR